MTQLRLNPLTGRWVVLSTARSVRPDAFTPRSLAVEDDPDRVCPFCPGNEETTPPALAVYGPPDEWRVRVVPNLFPAFSGRAKLAVENLGPVFTQSPAGGLHEVLVLSNRHDGSWKGADDEQVTLVMRALRDRLQAHADDGDVRYTQAIVNHGREAGASLEHPHGQLLGMPFVPGELADEQAGFARFSGGCLLCATVEAELTAGHRLVAAGGDAVAIAPFWSGVPYEMLVVPTTHGAHLHLTPDESLAGIGTVLRDAVSALLEFHGDVAFNVVFHSAPYRSNEYFHWHAHVLPKLTTQAGFELGTGVLINVIAPEDAAELLRGILAQ